MLSFRKLVFLGAVGLSSLLKVVVSIPASLQSLDQPNSNVHFLSQEEIDHELRLAHENGNTGLLKRLYADRHRDALSDSTLVKRGPESRNLCQDHNKYKNTSKGPQASLVYHWVSAQCSLPHQQPTFTVKCRSFYRNSKGKEVPMSEITWEDNCKPDQYCFDRERLDNGAGDHDVNGIPDIGCAQKQKRGPDLEGLRGRTKTNDNVEVCSNLLNPLDPKWANHRGSSSTGHRRFLITAEATCAGGKVCAPLEMYIMEKVPAEDRVDTLVEGSEVRNIQATVEYTGQEKATRLYQACVLLAAHYIMIEYVYYWTIYEIDRQHWKRDLSGTDQVLSSAVPMNIVDSGEVKYNAVSG